MSRLADHGGGAVLQVVRHFNDTNPEQSPSSYAPNLFGWHLDRNVLDFLTATGAELDIDVLTAFARGLAELGRELGDAAVATLTTLTTLTYGFAALAAVLAIGPALALTTHRRTTPAPQ
ncbi:DUF4279 domain-containing protein [Streptomyces lunaelactis]|uniref:DUF4279 domain-containing protein n=1 Tax=Streptomyces lunaelactis TaxID=1535768 RepID=UPI0027B8F1BE|nr:DUF4279 domain-containing protein [Streptomyces lunaelactis]